MPKEFLLPDLGEGITEAQVIRVLIKQGETITEDQYLMEVETDKAAVEIPSPYAGVAMQVHVSEGQTINVGDVIVTFDDGDDGGESTPAQAAQTVKTAQGAGSASATATLAAPPVIAPPPTGRTKTTVAAAPAVRKLAREMGIDLDSVVGSGPGGRITKDDLQSSHAQASMPVTVSPASPPPAWAAPMMRQSAASTPSAAPLGIADTDTWGPVRRVPLNQIRKTIASHMAKSVYTIPHVTHGDEADIMKLEIMRRQLNDATGGDPKLTVMSFVIRALTMALRKFPIFNSSFDEDGEQVIYKEYINVGIAVDTERGLIVPVIRDADKLTFRGIAAALRTIADRIRSNQFTIDDLRGGTFTITNVGALGGTFSTPIINHPEVAILGLGRSKTVPVFRDGAVVEGLILPVNLSFDHRATDGANAARFTSEIISYLQEPSRFLLES